MAKIFFRIEQDDVGYPSVGSESVWATEVAPGEYRIDNVLFFAHGAAFGDVVAVTVDDGVLCYARTLRPSGHSLLRVVLRDDERMTEVRDALRALGCISERFRSSFAAVDVPPTADLPAVQRYLAEASAAGWLEYEESILRAP